MCWVKLTRSIAGPTGLSGPRELHGRKQNLLYLRIKWDLWLGTAEETDYIDNLVPFNWRGWWGFGTGALGDMGCHIMGPPFKLLNLGYPTEVSCSASTVYTGIFKEGIFPESGPVSSSIRFKYELKNGKNLDLYWMDGGITPERPYEIDPDKNMNDIMGDWPGLNDYEGATLFIGTKGKAACGWGGRNPILLPLSRNKEINIPQKYPRVTVIWMVTGGSGSMPVLLVTGMRKLIRLLLDMRARLTETVLMGNLLLRCFNIQKKITRKDPVYGEMEGYIFPGRYISYKWDGENMKITNFEKANQFVKREYRKGWGEMKI